MSWPGGRRCCYAIDRAAAVRGLSEIFAAPKDRAMAEAVLRKAAELVGARIDATPHGPMAVLLARTTTRACQPRADRHAFWLGHVGA